VNEATQSGTQFVGDTVFIGEYGVPEDPMDAFQCESCQ
jgi:hypothetical protein